MLAATSGFLPSHTVNIQTLTILWNMQTVRSSSSPLGQWNLQEISCDVTAVAMTSPVVTQLVVVDAAETAEAVWTRASEHFYTVFGAAATCNKTLVSTFAFNSTLYKLDAAVIIISGGLQEPILN